MGFTHPMQEFMDLIVKTEMNEEDKQVVTKVNLIRLMIYFLNRRMMVTEMILVDMNQVTLSTLMVQIGGRKEIEPDLVRHMVLNSLGDIGKSSLMNMVNLCFVMMTRLIGEGMYFLTTNIVEKR